MNDGWVKIYRKITDHELWLSETFSRAQAWVDLLLIANHTDNVIRRRGIKITVKCGQVGYSQDSLAKRWRWSKNKVRRFLNELTNMNQITQQTELKNIAVSSLITLTNYKHYQDNGTINGTEEKPKKVLEQEGKEGKEGKEKTIKPLSPESLRLSGLLAELILKNNPTHRDLNNGKGETTIIRWANDIDKMLRIDGRDSPMVEKIIRWCQQDTFWLKNILSGETLRKQYDKLILKVDDDSKYEVHLGDL